MLYFPSKLSLSLSLAHLHTQKAAGTSFEKETYTYSESGLQASQSFPMITSCKIQNSITLLVKESECIDYNSYPNAYCYGYYIHYL